MVEIGNIHNTDGRSRGYRIHFYNFSSVKLVPFVGQESYQSPELVLCSDMDNAVFSHGSCTVPGMEQRDFCGETQTSCGSFPDTACPECAVVFDILWFSQYSVRCRGNSISLVLHSCDNHRIQTRQECVFISPVSLSCVGHYCHSAEYIDSLVECVIIQL